MSNLFNLKIVKKHMKKALKTIYAVRKDTKWEIYNFVSAYPINENFSKNISDASTEIFKNEDIRNSITKEEMDNKLKRIVGFIYLENYANEEKILDIELKKLEKGLNEFIETEIKEYTFVFEIDYLNLEKEFYQFGDIILFKYSEEDLSFLSKHVWLTKYEEFELGNTYCFVKSIGKKEYAEVLAKNKVSLLMAAIKLFNTDLRLCNFGLTGHISYPSVEKFLVNENDNTLEMRQLIGSCWDYELTDKDYEFYLEIGLDNVIDLINSDNLSEEEEKILIAIYWYGEAVSNFINEIKGRGDSKMFNDPDNLIYRNSADRLLKLFVALETLLLKDDEETIVNNISERASKLISDDLNCQKKIKKDIKKIYDNRSKFVHHGIPYIHKDDLNRLTNYVRIVILQKNKENKLKRSE